MIHCLVRPSFGYQRDGVPNRQLDPAVAAAVVRTPAGGHGKDSPHRPLMKSQGRTCALLRSSTVVFASSWII
jgi:hypothetical protein